MPCAACLAVQGWLACCPQHQACHPEDESSETRQASSVAPKQRPSLADRSAALCFARHWQPLPHGAEATAESVLTGQSWGQHGEWALTLQLWERREEAERNVHVLARGQPGQAAAGQVLTVQTLRLSGGRAEGGEHIGAQQSGRAVKPLLLGAGMLLAAVELCLPDAAEHAAGRVLTRLTSWLRVASHASGLQLVAAGLIGLSAPLHGAEHWLASETVQHRSLVMPAGEVGERSSCCGSCKRCGRALLAGTECTLASAKDLAAQQVKQGCSC